MKKITIDTHIHSKASDGTWTPGEVVRKADSIGLEAIALTDHDTTFGVKEALDAGKEYGITVIPGIEIDAEYFNESAKAKVKDIELLGLGIDLKAIQPFVNQRAGARIRSLEAYVRNFNKYIRSENYSSRNSQMKYQLENPSQLSVPDIISWRNKKDQYSNPAPFLSKMDVVNYVLENYAASSESVEKAKKGDRACAGEFKKEYGFLFEGKEAKPTFYEAIDAVKNASGKAIVAHPGLSKGYENGMVKEWELPRSEWFSETGKLTPYVFIKDLKAHGLDGVELYNYKGNDKPHAESQDKINEYFKALAGKLELMVTYGSDCHGMKGSEHQMGKFGGYKPYIDQIVNNKNNYLQKNMMR